MGIATLILGESGTGKSTSLRHLNPIDCLLIQADSKPLPFPSKSWLRWDKSTQSGSIITTDNWSIIKLGVEKAPSYSKKIVIIDDFQYVMANEYMRRSDEKNYDKFTEIGRHAWEIIKAAQNTSDVRVYILGHTTETDNGKIKIKTIGKLLDNNITIEGMFTTVLRTKVIDGSYKFTTRNNGYDTVKSPMGLFENNEIDNDLKYVDDRICEYYEIKEKTT